MPTDEHRVFAQQAWLSSQSNSDPNQVYNQAGLPNRAAEADWLHQGFDTQAWSELAIPLPYPSAGSPQYADLGLSIQAEEMLIHGSAPAAYDASDFQVEALCLWPHTSRENAEEYQHLNQGGPSADQLNSDGTPDWLTQDIGYDTRDHGAWLGLDTALSPSAMPVSDSEWGMEPYNPVPTICSVTGELPVAASLSACENWPHDCTKAVPDPQGTSPGVSTGVASFARQSTFGSENPTADSKKGQILAIETDNETKRRWLNRLASELCSRAIDDGLSVTQVDFSHGSKGLMSVPRKDQQSLEQLDPASYSKRMLRAQRRRDRLVSWEEKLSQTASNLSLDLTEIVSTLAKAEPPTAHYRAPCGLLMQQRVGALEARNASEQSRLRMIRANLGDIDLHDPQQPAYKALKTTRRHGPIFQPETLKKRLERAQRFGEVLKAAGRQIDSAVSRSTASVTGSEFLA
ncbi:hypothetical protein IAU60_005548 [Kwoniella sp. DSM 27419]